MNIKAFLVHKLARKKYNNNFKPAEFKKILIIRPAKIGDTICLFPLIRELKKALPSSRIDIYASTYNNFMFKNTPQVSHVYTKYRTKNTIRTIIDIFKMRFNKYDLIIDTLDVRLSSIIKLRIINAKWLLGNSGETNRYGINSSDISLYYKINPCNQSHISDRLLEFLPLLGISHYDSTMELKLSRESIQFAKSFLEEYAERKLIGLNADASDITRSMSDTDITDICRKLLSNNENITILLFCPSERKDHMSQLLEKANISGVILEQGTKSIFDAAALASFMHVIISSDTVFIHIASALDIPTVGIYQNNPNHVKCWGPKSKKHIIIYPSEPGNSIKGFSIEETITAATQLLD